MADDDHAEAARKRLAEEQKVTDRIKADGAARLKGKPTPTQEENDRHALGESFVGREHEHDGSDPDPYAATSKEMTAQHRPAQPYQTRQARAPSSSSSSSS